MATLKTVAVLFGGQSTEHAVSLQSAGAVLAALDQTKYRPVPIGITQSGAWLHYTGAFEHIAGGSWQNGPCEPAAILPDAGVHGMAEFLSDGVRFTRLDAAFPVLHGKNGEDGTVQGLIKLAGIPLVGCGVLGSAVCMDKDIACRLAAGAGVEVPPWVLFEQPEVERAVLARTAHLRGDLFVKPACAGSSFGVSRVSNRGDLAAALAQAFRQDSRVLVQQAIPGFEVGCAVLGSGEALTLGAVDEIELQAPVFDYEEKYSLKTSRIHTPARIPQQKADAVRQTAARLYRALRCEGLARVDLFLTPQGGIVFNEINTIPGFTSHSRYPRMMEAVGLSFETLVNGAVERAVNRL